MSEAFLKVVNMSISAGWLVLAVLALRLILKKAPKWVNVLLWGIVAIRLICPFSIESALSLIPSAETIPVNIGMDTSPAINSGISSINNAVNPLIGQSNTPMGGASVNPLQITIAIYANIWVLGVAAMLTYTGISYLSLRRKLRTAVVLRGNIFQCETVSSPFVLGILKPRIYLPYTMDGKNLDHVVAHEQAHIRRKDHWWKPLGFLLLTIHWFNPLMWIAYILLCRDIELACDEKVIAELPNEQRADYTQALVACAVNRRMIAACPLAFGEVGVKERVKSIMNYRKPTFWIIVLGLVVCLVVSVCFLTNPIILGDHFVLTNSDSPVNTNKLTYDIQLGNKAMSGEIYVEQWIDGTCVKSAPVVMTQFVDSIEITMRDRREDGASVGTDIQIETNQYGGSLLTYFAHPENLNVTGWGFKGYELDEKIKLVPNTELILAAKVFDCGNGVRTFDSETLIAEPERIENAAYMLVVRAVFSEDPLGATNHGEASLPTEVLTLNDVIILSQKGYDLTWSDFDQFDYVETGFGLYIRRYEINDLFHFSIGGAGPNSVPMYMYLGVNGDDPEARIDIREGGVTEFIQAHNDDIPISSDTVMVPTDTKLQGLHGGALLLPIDGSTYRYLLTDNTGEGVTSENFIFEFKEPDLKRTIDWKVYSLKEYPDQSVVMMVSEDEGPWLCTYSPPGRCSDTALDDAIKAGYVVMEDGIATHGQDVWKEFYDLTQEGKATSVTVAHYGTLDPERCDISYFEAFNQDYPFMSIYHLTFDGDNYTLSFMDGSVQHTKTYEYLMRYETDRYSVSSSTAPQKTIRYILTHDKKVIWEQLFGGMISSQAGAYIDHYSIYAERVN